MLAVAFGECPSLTHIPVHLYRGRLPQRHGVPVNNPLPWGSSSLSVSISVWMAVSALSVTTLISQIVSQVTFALMVRIWTRDN